MVKRLAPAVLPLILLAGFAGCADPNTGVRSRTANPTAAQQTRDTLDPARGPAEAAGRAADRAGNPNRP